MKKLVTNKTSNRESQNLKSILNIWKGRNLSLNGKITVLNNFALTPLIYVSSVIDTPAKAINEISNLIQNFLWNGSTSNISQKKTNTRY